MTETLLNKLTEFFSKHKLVKYKKGEVILRPGEKVDYVGFIKSGHVRVYYLSESGQEVTMQFFKPILFFTLIFAKTEIANKYYFEAVDGVEIYKSPAAETLEWFRNDREAMSMMTDCIMMAFLNLTDQIGYLLSGNAFSRVASMLVSLASKNGENSFRDTIDFGITHKLIASLTGLTRETVTLQMLKLEKQGLIVNQNKKIFIKDYEALIKASKNDIKE